MSLRTTLFSNRSDIVRTIVGVALTGALFLPVAIHESAAQAERVKATATLSESTGLLQEQRKLYPVIVRHRIDAAAADTLQRAQTVTQQAAGKTDLAPLTSAVAALTDYATMKADAVQSRTEAVEGAMQVVTAAAAEFDRVAAAQAAAQAAQAAQAAAAQAAANTPDGARATARSLAASAHGWGEDQFQCLDSLWSKESGWRYDASNSSSGATGIPQALPGSKMATAGADWQSNAATQIRWGLGYIAGSYGTPCAAWSHSQSVNWY